MASILVIDDEVDATEALCLFLRRAGHHVVHVNNGREALADLATIQPDIVVLDVMMPEMDGLSFLEVLRNYYHGAFLPVILLTGLAREAHVERAVKLGVKRIFVKGDYDLHELLNCVNQLAVSPLVASSAITALDRPAQFR